MYLCIDNLPFKMSPTLMLLIAFWAQNQCSYQAAEDILRSTHDIDINDDTIRTVTNYIGSLVFESDCKRAKQAEELLTKGALKAPKYRTKDNNSILYIEMDGAAINTRTEDDNGSTWRENKLGVIFSSDDIHYYRNSKTPSRTFHRIESCSYVTYLGSSNEFKWHLFAVALEQGYDPERKVVILSDGAKWIRNISEEIFPGAIMILDLFHLKENVHTFSKSAFEPDEEKAREWADNICMLLENGKSAEALAIIKKVKAKGNFDLHSYITSNLDRIDYPKYKEEGLFIGSGAVESGNKIILQKRLKQAGMRWNPQNAQPMLTLRAKQESGKWISDVESVLASRFPVFAENLKIPRN